MHPEHGGTQPCYPTDRPGGDRSGYSGLWLVGRDEDKEGNGWGSNEVGEHAPLIAGFDESLVDFSFQGEILTFLKCEPCLRGNWSFPSFRSLSYDITGRGGSYDYLR